MGTRETAGGRSALASDRQFGRFVGDRASRVVIQKALSADHDVTLAETNRRGHATRLAEGAAADGVDVVAVLGGDGTQNEAANGLAGTQTALASLPGGSTNVFARTIGLPNDPIEATGVLLDALAKKSIRRIGLGSVNDRYFLFHTGVGFDAAVVRQVERRDTFKRWFGHPLFIYATVVTWLRHYDRRHPHFAVRFSEHDAPGSLVDDGYFTIVMNTSPYTFLGNRPFDIAPEATFDRGLVAVTVRSLGFGMALTLARTAFVSPKALRDSRSVDFRTDLEQFEVVGHAPFPYQVDGDYLGEIDRLRFRHEPDTLSLVVPDPASSASGPAQHA